MNVPVIARLQLPDGREFAVHTTTEPDADPDIGDPSAPYSVTVYSWTDGNMSCDCNRKMYIDRQHGTHIDDGKCGDTIELVSLSICGREMLR